MAATMALSSAQFELPPTDQLRLLKRVQRVVLGSASSTPSPNLLRFADVGLLYFLNQKQSQLHSIVSTVDLSAQPRLRTIAAVVEFIQFVVGGLIVEAERIDEAVILAKKAAADIGEELRKQDLDLQFRKETLGTAVEQTISQHYKTRLNIPSLSPSANRRLPARSTTPGRTSRVGGKSSVASTSHHTTPNRTRIDVLTQAELNELEDLPTTIETLRRQLKLVKGHLKALQAIQRLLHGSGLELPEEEINAVVSELDILATFRKANHRVRDVLYDVAQKEDLAAANSLIEFIGYLDSGLGMAMDDVRGAEMNLKKLAVVAERDQHHSRLDAINARNKHSSAEALKMNEMMGQDLAIRARSNSAQHSSSVHQQPQPLPYNTYRSGSSQSQQQQQQQQFGPTSGAAAPSSNGVAHTRSKQHVAAPNPPASFTPVSAAANNRSNVPSSLQPQYRTPYATGAQTARGGGASSRFGLQHDHVASAAAPLQVPKSSSLVDDELERFFAHHCA